ncbi:MAG: hypothetical protein ABSG14_07700 [Verrucomicrobiia bacterium]|jgi:TRAP-type C4-dicarboxylate transport system permease small subunit
MKYVVAAISFLFVWLGVAVVCGMIMVMVFPTQRATVVGIGGDWRNLPGTILGVLAGVQSWRVSLRKAKEKEAKKQLKS